MPQYLVQDHPSLLDSGVEAGDIMDTFVGDTFGLVDDANAATGEEHIALCYANDDEIFVVLPRSAVVLFRA